MKIINFLVLASLLVVFSCKKEEEPVINPCANGVKDNGEEEIDCGGTCSACYHYPYLVFKYQGSTKQANDKTLVFDGTNWLLQASFDTVQFQLNLGTSGIVGTYDMEATKSSCIGGQLPYTFVSGIYGISAHNTSTKEMSGQFNAYFLRGTDTIKFEAGQFEYLKY